MTDHEVHPAEKLVKLGKKGQKLQEDFTSFLLN